MCFQTDEINVLPESFSQDQVQKDSERTYNIFRRKYNYDIIETG